MLGYVMRDTQGRIIIVEGQKLDDCPIFVAKCLVVRETNYYGHFENIQNFILGSDFTP